MKRAAMEAIHMGFVVWLDFVGFVAAVWLGFMVAGFHGS